MIYRSSIGLGDLPEDPSFGPIDTGTGPGPSSGDGVDYTKIANSIASVTSKLSPEQRAAIVASASSIGAAVGSVVPFLGTAIGAAVGTVIGEVASLVHGKTQKMSWAQANAEATDYANKFVANLQASLTAEQFHTLALHFPDYYKNFVASSGWWDQSTRDLYVSAYDRDIMPQTTDYNRVRVTMWDAAIWIFGNIDVARPETAGDFFKTFLLNTLVPILQGMGITSGNINPTDPTKTVTTPPANTSTKNASLAVGAFVGVMLLSTAISGGVRSRRAA